MAKITLVLKEPDDSQKEETMSQVKLDDQALQERITSLLQKIQEAASELEGSDIYEVIWQQFADKCQELQQQAENLLSEIKVAISIYVMCRAVTLPNHQGMSKHEAPLRDMHGKISQCIQALDEVGKIRAE